MKQLQYVLLACGLAATAGIHAPPKKKKTTPAATATDFAGPHIIMQGQQPALEQHIAELKAGLDSKDVAVYWKTLVKLYAEFVLAKASKNLALAKNKSHGKDFVAMATPLFNEVPAARKTALTKAVASYQKAHKEPAEDANYTLQYDYYKKLYKYLETNIPAGFTLAYVPGATPAKTVKAPAIKTPEAQLITAVKADLAKDAAYKTLPDQKAKTAKMVLAGQVAAQWLQHSPHATAADKAKVIPAIVSGVLKAPDGATADSIKIAPIPTPKPKGAGSKMSPVEIQANLVNLGDALIALQQAAGI